jgi:hypothetical protein
MLPLSELFFLGIVIYLLYGFVFRFILPIFRTTRHVRQQFRNMQDQANMHQHTTAGQDTGPQPKRPNASQSNNTMGEYIDFEEIKSK